MARSADSRRAAQRKGRFGEALCAAWLRLRGWRILARGYVTGRGSGAGEVDIIAQRGSLVAFMEIKTRPTEIEAIEAITPAQTRRIARGAEAFLASRPDLAGLDVRFDALLVIPHRLPRHIPDAWRPEW
ncbi:MAG: hypothetical protein A2516_10410 [Alphaproteobacteria bacterium RIFOXYD12_FULL_60_8]|nr:MAG: hypothetical protein A2516_10410 [Alphaproteobacteria bacterium RIFOXYD12_FULL_60_8]